MIFFYNGPATNAFYTDVHTLSLTVARPISPSQPNQSGRLQGPAERKRPDGTTELLFLTASGSRASILFQQVSTAIGLLVLCLCALALDRKSTRLNSSH